MNWYSALKSDLWSSSIYSKLQALLVNSAEINPGATLKLYLLLEGLKTTLEAPAQDSDRLFQLLGAISASLETLQPLTDLEKQEINSILERNALPAFFHQPQHNKSIY